MARIQHIAPTPVEMTDRAKAQALEWEFEGTQWVQPGAFAGADYPEPDGDERLFYTVAMKVGRKRDLDACIDVLAVTGDLEDAIEMRLPAAIDDETLAVTLVNHDRVPAGFVTVPKADSDDPSNCHEKYRELLEQAHDVAVENGGDE